MQECLSPFPFETILKWYKQHGQHSLPWRKEHDPYKIWIAEIILQQTQKKRACEYYHAIIEKFPTIFSLASVCYETFYEYWKWLGYYQRAKNILQTAHILVESYQGVFPKEEARLMTLPGIGPYTAKAILAFAYDIPVLAFDTNLNKVFARYYFWTRFYTLSSKEKQAIELQLQTQKLSGKQINEALMDFWQLVDHNSISKINFENYPLKQSIFFLEKGKKELANTQKRSTPQKYKNMYGIIFLHKNHKLYFSSCNAFYAPFIFSIPSIHMLRQQVLQYFQEVYNISISLRPPFLKKIIQSTCFLFSYGQIQVGSVPFPSFSKKEQENFLQTIDTPHFFSEKFPIFLKNMVY